MRRDGRHRQMLPDAFNASDGFALRSALQISGYLMRQPRAAIISTAMLPGIDADMPFSARALMPRDRRTDISSSCHFTIDITADDYAGDD